MSKIIPIKEFRKNLASFADIVEQGENIIVIRRSIPVFKVIPVSKTEIEDESGWENLIDFTEGGKKEGISAKTLLEKMKNFAKKHG